MPIVKYLNIARIRCGLRQISLAFCYNFACNGKCHIDGRRTGVSWPTVEEICQYTSSCGCSVASQ